MVQQTWHALTDELVHRQPWPEANLSQCRHSFTFTFTFTLTLTLTLTLTIILSPRMTRWAWGMAK